MRQRSIVLDEDESKISGLSGTLISREPSTIGGQIKLLFETHPYPVLQKVLALGKFPVTNLILLMLGYIRLNDKVCISMRDTRKLEALQEREVLPIDVRSFAERLNIASIKHGEVPRQDASILKRIGIDVPSVQILQLEDLRTAFPQDRGDEITPELLRAGCYFEIGDFERYHNVWIERRIVQRFVLAYLSQKMSPEGVLYSMRKDMFVLKVLKAGSLRWTLEIAKSVIRHLGKPEPVAMELQQAIHAVTDTDLCQVSWSRRAFKSFTALYDATDALFKTQGFEWKSISILCAYDLGFQARLKENIYTMAAGDHSGVEFDTARNTITMPGLDNQDNITDFPFDFAYTFSQTDLSSNLINGRMPLTHAVFAALQGHLRAVMWNMCMEPEGLLNMLTPALPDGACLLGASRVERRSHVPVSTSSPSRPWSRSTPQSYINEHQPEDQIYARRPFSPADAVLEHTDCDLSSDIAQAVRVAASRGHDDVVRVLLNYSTATTDVQSALFAASEIGYVPVVRDLLDKGPSIEAAQSALNVACMNGHAEVVRILLDESEPNLETSYALAEASRSGHCDVVRLLLSRNDLRTSVRRFAIMLASENGHAEVVQLLLDMEATDSPVPG